MPTTREAQRRRTRRDLVAAAQRLLAAGRSPGVDEIAEEADVSRRTVYSYFPTLDQLLLDASVGLVGSTAVDEALDDGPADAVDRIEALVRAVWATAEETLPLGRQIIRLTVTDPQSRRGFRRLAWIERALEPDRDRLDPAAYERLVSSLAPLVGWETMTVLRDVRQLSPRDEIDAVVWACRALVETALAQSQDGAATGSDQTTTKRSKTTSGSSSTSQPRAAKARAK